MRHISVNKTAFLKIYSKTFQDNFFKKYFHGERVKKAFPTKMIILFYNDTSIL